MLSLTHPTTDRYLCRTHVYWSAASAECVSHILHRLISFSVNELTSCVHYYHHRTVEERTCALPGIVFNSKPRLIFNPCTIRSCSCSSSSNVYVSSTTSLVRSLSIFLVLTTHTLILIWLIVYISHALNTYPSALCPCLCVRAYGWHWSSSMFALPCFVPRFSTEKLIQQKTFLPHAVVCIGCDKPQQIWNSKPFHKYNSQK